MGFRAFVVGIALLGLAAGTAQAQYYPHRPLGVQCRAVAATPGGRSVVVCPMRYARPLGAPCHCPPPPPPPGYAFGPPLRGRVIP